MKRTSRQNDGALQLHQAERNFHLRSERHLPEIARKRGP